MLERNIYWRRMIVSIAAQLVLSDFLLLLVRRLLVTNNWIHTTMSSMYLTWSSQSLLETILYSIENLPTKPNKRQNSECKRISTHLHWHSDDVIDQYQDLWNKMFGWNHWEIHRLMATNSVADVLVNALKSNSVLFHRCIRIPDQKMKLLFEIFSRWNYLSACTTVLLRTSSNNKSIGYQIRWWWWWWRLAYSSIECWWRQLCFGIFIR